ncbi:MAG: hypothetical protein ABR865_05610 [Terracidiphilus sp.]|jgi:hypothetical protein
MVSFRRLAILLALSLPVMPAVQAQSSSSSSSSATPDQNLNLAQNQPSDDAQQPAGETQGQISVQERIRQRRAQRRSTAIHDAYDHRWESYMDMGYLRFTPGPSLQRLTYYAWETGLTRFSNERLGFTLDGRGNFGTAYVGLNPYSQGKFTRPAISQYDVIGGPVYRFYLQPKYSISGRAMAGWAHGNFSGDTNGIPPALLGLYPDANTFAASVSVIGELNIAPNIALKLAPEYFFTGFGSTVQASRGFTAGLVYRWGKQ